MEGRLRNEALTIEIRTKCVHCDRQITMTLDGDLRYEIAQQEAKPLVFEPRIDWPAFRERNIIGHY